MLLGHAEQLANELRAVAEVLLDLWTVKGLSGVRKSCCQVNPVFNVGRPLGWSLNQTESKSLKHKMKYQKELLLDRICPYCVLIHPYFVLVGNLLKMNLQCDSTNQHL